MENEFDASASSEIVRKETEMQRTLVHSTRPFDAEGLVARLLLGELDADLAGELRRLSAPQLEEVVSLLESSTETDGGDHTRLLDRSEGQISYWQSSRTSLKAGPVRSVANLTQVGALPYISSKWPSYPEK